MAELRADRSFLRDVQYRTDVNLAARQSIYACQHPRIDLAARVPDLAAPARLPNGPGSLFVPRFRFGTMAHVSIC